MFLGEPEMHLLWQKNNKMLWVCLHRAGSDCVHAPMQNSVCVHLLCVYEDLTYPCLSEYPRQPYEQHDTPDIQHASHLQTQARGQTAAECMWSLLWSLLITHQNSFDPSKLHHASGLLLLQRDDGLHIAQRRGIRSFSVLARTANIKASVLTVDQIKHFWVDNRLICILLHTRSSYVFVPHMTWWKKLRCVLWP